MNASTSPSPGRARSSSAVRRLPTARKASHAEVRMVHPGSASWLVQVPSGDSMTSAPTSASVEPAEQGLERSRHDEVGGEGVVVGAADGGPQVVLVGGEVVEQHGGGAQHPGHGLVEGLPLGDQLGDRLTPSLLDQAVEPGLQVAVGQVPSSDRRREGHVVGDQVVHRPLRARRHGRGQLRRA